MISSCSNPLVKSVYALRHSKNRERESKFIFEGSKLFSEAIDWKIPLTHVLITDRWLERSSPELKDKLNASNAEIIHITETVMSKCSLQIHPEGILCCADTFTKPFPDEVSSVVLLENVQDPGNVGTIIRTADAAGYQAVITTIGTANCYNEKVLRASMGSVFHLPVIQHQEGNTIINRLKEDHFLVIGAALDGKEKKYLSPPESNKKVVILGNESSGMSQELQRKCDCLVRIPMYGHAESLNVSIAAGLMLYQFR